MVRRNLIPIGPAQPFTVKHTYICIKDTQVQKGMSLLPQWLLNQLKRAYESKDRRQIRLLNDCWFFYKSSTEPKTPRKSR